MSLYLPPGVTRELMDERRRREAAAFDVLRAEARWDWVKEFNAQLDRIVSGMKIVWCPDPAPVDAVACGAAPGRWNLIWPGFQGGPMTVKPLEDDDGNYMEPGSWVFDMIARMDLWDDRVMRERRRIKRLAEEASARRVERERAARDQEVYERVLANTRAQVSMSRDTRWSQNVAGKRGVKE